MAQTIVKAIKMSGNNEEDKEALASAMGKLLERGYTHTQIHDYGPGSLDYDLISIGGQQNFVTDVVLLVASK